MPNRGRPRLLSDEAILEAALAAFATSGYAAMSVRALNAELGLSHETVSKRFGPKADLFRAAIGFGAARFVTDYDRAIAESAPTDDLTRLRSTVRAFIVAASRNPTLGELLHNDRIEDAERNLLLGETGLGERLADAIALIDRLNATGAIRETRIRELWFLAQGASAALRFDALARMFDPFDGPIEDAELIERMTDAIMRSTGAPEPKTP